MSALPARIDVAIIGGGFAGCATAWALRAQGIDVVVLEREDELGRYASGRGAGMGRQLAEDDTTTELTVRGAERLRGELADAWSPTGGILSFDDAAEAERYAARAERFGIPATPLARGEVLARWPEVTGLAIERALLVPSDGLIDTRRLLARFSAGATIVLGAGASVVEPGGLGACVRTARGAVEARVVVDASGAWAGACTGDAPLAAVTRNLFLLEAAPPAAAPYLWHLGHDEMYVRADGGHVLASACDATREPATDAQPDPARAKELAALLARVAPPLATAMHREQRACQRSFAPDRRMRLGRDRDRPWLVWAAALGGHGATASAAVGERVAAAVIEALT
ncbi:MAG TPA: FAD-dependent oxidoreductase [Kofleriaceae bacterium]|nr:FAD-dependent oxidoreductase [Kofleriaceae bacterium]